jgi:hypothetical protein
MCADGDHDACNQHDNNAKCRNEVVPAEATADISLAEELATDESECNHHYTEMLAIVGRRWNVMGTYLLLQQT